MKHLVALKLYTDFDLLQRELRKSYRSPYNEDIERLRSFYHWIKVLKSTFKRFSNVKHAMKQPKRLYHGVNSFMFIDQFEGN